MTEQENNLGQSAGSRGADRIRGWLLVYLIMSVIVDVAAIVLLLTSASRLTPDANELSMLVFMILAACVMTGYLVAAFMKRKLDAAFLGKHHVIINALPGVCVLDWLLHTESDIFIILAAVLFLVYLIVWRVFFNMSSQVKALILPATRKVSGREKYLVTFLYLAIGVLYCIHAGFDRWWRTVFALVGLLSFSPMFDEFGNSGTVGKDEQDK